MKRPSSQPRLPRKRRRFITIGIAAGGLLCAAAVMITQLDNPGEPPKEYRGRGLGGVRFVSSEACAECHRQQYEDWRGSQHRVAMQPADKETVLGDFNDVAFEHFGVTTRFFRKDGRFFVLTEGPEGQAAEYEVQYTFGVDPLQQYLIEFPGGRLQCLTVAWDTKKQRWFHLYPDQRIDSDNALHWTGRYQVWNHMCASCHTTDLRKNYEPESDSYATTWAELGVGCESCHGPGEAHKRWAGALPEGAMPNPADYALQVEFKGAEPEKEIQTCAPCHSRRQPVSGSPQHGRPYFDDFMVETLREGLYHPDGQILDEVYVYGSFLQSKMHREGVRCSDCHNPHSLQLQSPGNGVCVRCHQTAPPEQFPTLKGKEYDTPEHHFHKAGSDGAQCVNCHAPERTYMVVDPRRDHSFRVPRPDLSVKLGTPNACNDCHEEESPQWAAAAVEKWYGPERQQTPHFGEAIAAGRSGDPAARSKLVELAGDTEQPAIARGTALELLRGYGLDGVTAMMLAIQDPDPIVRRSAAGGLNLLPPQPRRDTVAPLLEDPTRAVRVEAARVLASASPESLDSEERSEFESALDEYREVLRATADVPSGQLNLGRLHADMGRTELAEKHYRTAVRMDPRLAAAPLALAALYNQLGRNADAERVLRDALHDIPNEGEIHYSLGLLVAEEDRLEEAQKWLRQAAELLPGRARPRYNLGLTLQHLGRRPEAEKQLLRAYEIDPADPDIVNALAIFYWQEGHLEKALFYARRLVDLVPGAPGALQLQQQIEAQMAPSAGRD